MPEEDNKVPETNSDCLKNVDIQEIFSDVKNAKFSDCPNMKAMLEMDDSIHIIFSDCLIPYQNFGLLKILLKQADMTKIVILKRSSSQK